MGQEQQAKKGGAATKLNQGGSESKLSGIYVPTNNAAIAAYLNAGRYDNYFQAEQAAARVMTVGIKQTQKVENDLLVVDGFKLFYYGDPDLPASVTLIQRLCPLKSRATTTSMEYASPSPVVASPS